MDKKYTSYCGLFCLDCIPSNKRLFSTARDLAKLLSDVQFEKYAEIKAVKNKVFERYPELVELLHEIIKLECKAPCREGGGKAECKVRECALIRHYEGCWECDDYGKCELLGPLNKIHPNLKYHLELIRKEGPENWCIKRGKHYSWG